MQYRKAKILPVNLAPKEGHNRFIWVESAPPKKHWHIGLQKGVLGISDVYFSYLKSAENAPIVFYPEEIELLPEFCNDILPVFLEDWLHDEEKKQS